MEYYVYQLIDPKNNKIFYVGKGQKLRMYAHVKDVRRDKMPNRTNKKFAKKIKKILESGLKVKYKKVFITENEQKAFRREIFLIKKIGLKNLCNLSEGGVGGCNGNKSNKGRTFTAEHRKKISDSVKIAMANLPKKTKRKIAKKYMSEETKRKLYKRVSKRMMGNTHRLGQKCSANHRKNLSASLKKYWENK